jgi:photosystem II stability/assembly factor-like uncharacterized protein
MKKYLLSAVTFMLMYTATAQWVPQNATFINNRLGFYEMSLPDKNTTWAICYDGVNGLGSGRLVLDFTRTTNGGNTWTSGLMGNDTTLEFSNISAVSKNEAWVAMHKRFGITGGGLYHTTNGGVTWNQEGAGEIFDENSFPNFVYFKDKNHGVAMGDPNGGYFEIYTTNNKGKKWKRVTPAHLSATLPNEYGFISGYYAIGNTIWFGTTTGRIWKSENMGKDWTAHDAQLNGGFINEIAFNDDKLHGVAHIRNSGGTFLLSTSDGGITWTNLGKPVNWKRSRITAVPGTNALVSTSVVPIDPGSAVSYDNGVTWTTIDNTIPMAVSRFYNRTTGYAGSFYFAGPPFNPGIYKSQIVFQDPPCHNNRMAEANENISSAQQEKIATEASVKVYPVPANDVVNIALPETFARTTTVINILSMDGKVLETRRSKATGLVQINVGKLMPGFYTVRITSNGNTINKAITIVR